MYDKKNKRIGLFEYDWSFYGFIKDFALKLAEAGYSVDFFLKDWDIGPDFAKTGEFELYENIRFYNFTIQPTKSQVLRRKFIRLLNIIAIFFSIKLQGKPDDIIDQK